jgi:acyl carrier protein
MQHLIDELRGKIITALKLTDIKAEDIDPDAPLVGAGLGLDSIDTLELLVMLEKDYGVTVSDVNIGRSVFSSVRALAEYVEKHRASA